MLILIISNIYINTENERENSQQFKRNINIENTVLKRTKCHPPRMHWDPRVNDSRYNTGQNKKFKVHTSAISLIRFFTSCLDSYDSVRNVPVITHSPATTFCRTPPLIVPIVTTTFPCS